MRRIFYFPLALLWCGALLSPFFAFSQTITTPPGANASEIDALNKQIADRQAKVKQLEESIDDYKKKIQQKQLESASLGNQVAILDTRVEQVKTDVQATEEKLDTVSLQIEALELSIADNQKVIERQKRMVAEFLRAIHQADGDSFIEILAAYDNFSDFYNRLQYLERIDRDIGKSVKDLRAAKESLERKTAAAKERKTAYEALKAELVNKQKDLEANVFAKQDLLAKTRASEAAYQTLLSSLKKQYQNTEDEISAIESQMKKKLERQQKISDASPDSENLFAWPTQSRYVTAYFHDPSYPFRNVFEHDAVDIRASHGTPVRAAGSGYVAQAKRCTAASCYSYITIIHTDSLSTIYGHLSQLAVSPEQFVTRGDIIGYSGGTPGTVGAGPFVTGPHLHFGVRKNGIPVNPLDYLVRDF